MVIYHKLVRDKIPDLIRNQGEQPVIRILDDGEYTDCLEAKLEEEVKEYLSDKNIEELADILEVVFALGENLGASRQMLMDACQKKHEERGGFSERILLVSKE